MKKDESLDPLLRRTLRTRDATSPEKACLDAETLAAWSDGSLTAAERATAEAHAADCDRCLAVLAAIVKTSPAPAPAQPSWLSMRWLVPLATAAVALMAWMVIQAPPAPSTPDAVLADASKEDRPELQSQAKAAAPTQIDALKKQRESGATAPLKDQDRPRSTAEIAARRSDAALDRVAAAEKRKPEAGSQKPPESPKPEAGSRKPEAKPQAPSREPQAVREPQASSRKPELKDERTRQFSAALSAPITIASPDNAVRWRLAGRTVERSVDAGRTWSAQTTGTSIDLLAGAAPSMNVCWIVGRTGVVLLTTDGTTWRRLEFPDTSLDLVGVVARDALDASVTAANGRRYRTTDGGRTWTLQENPPAPF